MISNKCGSLKIVYKAPWRSHLFLSPITEERIAADYLELHSVPPHEKKAERVNDKGSRLGMDDTISATQMEGVGRQRTGINARVKPCCLGST